MSELVPYTRFAAVVSLLLAAEEVGKTIYRVHFMAPANHLKVSTSTGMVVRVVVVVVIIIIIVTIIIIVVVVVVVVVGDIRIGAVFVVVVVVVGSR